MPNQHGEFIWYELLSDNPDASQDFYGKLLGWHVSDNGKMAHDYRILLAKDKDTGEDHGVGGILPLTAEMRKEGAKQLWVGYICVDDVDQTVEQIVTLGGQVLMAATDIPDVGRLALVTDPQNIPFYIMRGSCEGTSLAFASDKPRVGHCAWNELITRDTEAAKHFYFTVFGWSKDGEMDLGPMGSYEFIRHNGIIGAVMPKPDDEPIAKWNFYFRCSDIDQACETIRANGGTVVFGPNSIPGDEFIVKAVDPQQAMFYLIGKRNPQ